MSFVYNPIKLHKSLEALKEGTDAFEQDEEQISKAVEAFKFSFELFWRLLRRILEDRGHKAPTPWITFTLAQREGFIVHLATWAAFEKTRHDLGAFLETTPQGEIIVLFRDFHQKTTTALVTILEIANKEDEDAQPG